MLLPLQSYIAAADAMRPPCDVAFVQQRQLVTVQSRGQAGEAPCVAHNMQVAAFQSFFKRFYEMQVAAFQSWFQAMKHSHDGFASLPKWWRPEMLRAYLFILSHLERSDADVPAIMLPDMKVCLDRAGFAAPALNSAGEAS